MIGWGWGSDGFRLPGPVGAGAPVLVGARLLLLRLLRLGRGAAARAQVALDVVDVVRRRLAAAGLVGRDGAEDAFHEGGALARRAGVADEVVVRDERLDQRQAELGGRRGDLGLRDGVEEVAADERRGIAEARLAEREAERVMAAGLAGAGTAGAGNGFVASGTVGAAGGAAAAGFDRFFFPVFFGTQIKATSSSPSGVTVFVRGARIAGGGGRDPGPLTGTQTSGTSSSSILCVSNSGATACRESESVEHFFSLSDAHGAAAKKKRWGSSAKYR